MEKYKTIKISKTFLRIGTKIKGNLIKFGKNNTDLNLILETKTLKKLSNIINFKKLLKTKKF